jgi:hypothetical protein
LSKRSAKKFRSSVPCRPGPSRPIPSVPVPSRAIPSHPTPSRRTSSRFVEAIGLEVSEIVGGSTASQPDIDSIRVCKHARIGMQRYAKRSIQGGKKFRRCTCVQFSCGRHSSGRRLRCGRRGVVPRTPNRWVLLAAACRIDDRKAHAQYMLHVCYVLVSRVLDVTGV